MQSLANTPSGVKPDTYSRKLTQPALPPGPEAAPALTVLRSKGLRLAKQRTPAGWIAYEDAKHFAPFSVRVGSPEDLHAVLTELRARPTCAVVRGQPLDPAPGFRPRVLHGAPGRPATFAPAARPWTMLDIDNADLPPGLSMQRSAEAACWVRDRLLPPAFVQAGMVWQASARAGEDPSKAKLHLWFWLDRPVSDAELRIWLADSPVDPALFNAIQLHYTADPVFVGAPDPMRGDRLGLVAGETVRVPTIEVPAPRPRPRNGAMIGTAPDRMSLRLLVSTLHTARGPIALGRDALKALLAGEPFATQGQRDSALFGLACILVEAYPHHDTATIIAPFRAELVRQTEHERWSAGDGAAELESKMLRVGGV